jgi:dihydrodipicolinate synthase/N-acetylneuraminate lyase
MSNRERFFGVNPVVPTPLAEDERLDTAGLQHLVDFYVDSGCHGLTIMGSGGEFPYFTLEEKTEVIRTAVSAARGRVPVIVGGGHYSAAETLRFVRECGALDLDAFLLLPPTYFPVAFDDLLEMYAAICRQSPKPVLYYNYPQQSGVFLTPEQIARIVGIEGMAGMKDSVISVREIGQHLERIKGHDRALLNGNSLSLLRILEKGGNGVIGLLPSLFPKTVVECFSAWNKGDRVTAWRLQNTLLDLIPFMNSFGLPAWAQKAGFKLLSRLPLRQTGRNASRHAVFKEALRQMGHPITARVRSPLPQITERDKQAIQALLARHPLA